VTTADMVSVYALACSAHGSVEAPAPVSVMDPATLHDGRTINGEPAFTVGLTAFSPGGLLRQAAVDQHQSPQGKPSAVSSRLLQRLSLPGLLHTASGPSGPAVTISSVLCLPVSSASTRVFAVRPSAAEAIATRPTIDVAADKLPVPSLFLLLGLSTGHVLLFEVSASAQASLLATIPPYSPGAASTASPAHTSPVRRLLAIGLTRVLVVHEGQAATWPVAAFACAHCLSAVVPYPRDRISNDVAVA